MAYHHLGDPVNIVVLKHLLEQMRVVLFGFSLNPTLNAKLDFPDGLVPELDSTHGALGFGVDPIRYAVEVVSVAAFDDSQVVQAVVQTDGTGRHFHVFSFEELGDVHVWRRGRTGRSLLFGRAETHLGIIIIIISG